MSRTAVSFVNARVLGPGGVIAARLRVAGSCFAALDAEPRRGDLVVDLNGGVVLPGLINAHDHLELNNFPRLKWQERYPSATEWIADFQPRFASDPLLAAPRAVPLADRLLVGGLKNLLAGATTVCHHNPLHMPLRRGFPVRVVSRYRYSHSFLIDGDDLARVFRRTPRDCPWIVHLAEGTNASAAAEFGRLEQLGCLGPNTVLVHGVGLSPGDKAQVVERGGGLIWCPASNLFTLGATADVRVLAQAGQVALGSDSRLSGERDLLDELRVAEATQQVTTAALFRMVSTDAARMLRLPHAGCIAPGFPADLVLLPAGDGSPLAQLLTARRADLRLVMIGGRPMVGDPDLASVFAATHTPVERVLLDGREKLLARWLVDRLRRCCISEEGLEVASTGAE